EQYIEDNKIENIVTLHGNQSRDCIKESLKKSHFLVLPSKSEGWPKAVAEAMFFGVIPIASPVSCIPDMLDNGRRGILIEPDLEEAVKVIHASLTKDLNTMAKLGSDWSQHYTLD